MTAERIRGYWIIKFEPVAGKNGWFKLAQVSTDQAENKGFEDVIRAAVIPLSVKWGEDTETDLDPWRDLYPGTISVSKQKISLTLRPPETMLNANNLKSRPFATLRGRSYLPSNVRIRSLDPGVLLDQALHLEWRRDAAGTNDRTKPYISGPYGLNVGLTSATATVTSNDNQTSENDQCESGSCGGLICTPKPGYCLPCAECGSVCCQQSKGLSKLSLIGLELIDLSIDLLVHQR